MIDTDNLDAVEAELSASEAPQITNEQKQSLINAVNSELKTYGSKELNPVIEKIMFRINNDILTMDDVQEMLKQIKDVKDKSGKNEKLWRG